MTRRTHRFSRSKLWSMYWEHGMDLRQIGAELGASKSVLHRAMRHFGIELRGSQSYKEATRCKHCERLPYGGNALCREHLREYWRRKKLESNRRRKSLDAAAK